MIKITAKQQTALKWEPTQSSEQPPDHVVKCISGKQLIIDRAILAPDGKHAQVFFNPPPTIKLNGIATVWPSGYLWIEHWPELGRMFSNPPAPGASLWGPETMQWKPWLKAYSKAIGGQISTPDTSGLGPKKYTPQQFRLNSIATAMIKSYEGLDLEAYLCDAGVPTIGIGTTVYPDGRAVRIGDRCTEADALAYFRSDIDRFVGALRSLIDVSLTGRQIAALISFVYNVGIGSETDPDSPGLAGSTLRKAINQSAPAGKIQDQFRRWTNGGLSGLVSRRESECELWQGGDWEKHR